MLALLGAMQRGHDLMGYVYEDGTPVGDKTKVLQQAEDKLVKARDLLRECRQALGGFGVTAEHALLWAKITDFIGD